ncbi:hypothetical protein TSUD_360170 [Trifolium subterraneum]|uniref:Aminotransferase-like plant mobile domain-containing protein n=1 Tax=Trifolium subterraneum TaxID=3900 RepID=A0A2Z6MBU5_TRISU|nr:hypothetical protein TSUD_360170 [Trifolium subterraneum]
MAVMKVGAAIRNLESKILATYANICTQISDKLFSSRQYGHLQISSGIKWFQPHLDRSCGGSNRGPPYQVQRQSPLNQLTIVVRTRGRDGRIRHADVGRGVSVPVEQEQDIERPVIVEQPVMQEDVAQHGWPGGPFDTSLLTRYSDHVARYIWFEHIEGLKPELRIASLGAKLFSWIPGLGGHQENIQSWLDDSGLKWLERTSLTKVDPQLLSAFTKRWHPETSSFHMPFGEITITLDGVACLLHIPVRGVFYTPVAVSMEEAAALATELLGVPYEEAYLETSRKRGRTFTQQWLYDCWQRNLHMYHRYDCAARAFSWASAALVCLYDNLNDASMFSTHALAGYPTLLQRGRTFTQQWLYDCWQRNLHMYHRYDCAARAFSWASAALVCLYDNLNDASMFSTHALAGYPTLLQCWIHEYFPALGHRGSIPADLITCFSGYLRGFTVVPYLLERCLRQFGFIQYIQPPPPHLTRPVTFAAETTANYLSWYYIVSHHILCRPHDGPHGAPPVPQFVPPYAPPEDDPVPEDAPPVGERRWRDAVVSALERFIAHVDADREDETFEDIYFALDVARGDRDID